MSFITAKLTFNFQEGPHEVKLQTAHMHTHTLMPQFKSNKACGLFTITYPMMF